MTTEMARLKLRQEYPEFAMEIEEYLSFADIDKLNDLELMDDFSEYLEK